MSAAPSIEILAVEGMPELRPGDDLTAELAAAAPWLRDGDILVVTSKIVSKVEGRLLPAPSDPVLREQARQRAVDDESVRLVAARGPTRIVQTRHGFVLAAAGVDASNVRGDEIALLPVDPDASAERLRKGLRATLGVDVAVVVSDTAGRPWRVGVVDHAVGVAGLRALHSLRGVTDPMGNVLSMTEIAVADEVAAAADLVKGKLSGIPVAVLRGLSIVDDGRGVRPLIRDAELDMFRLGTAEAIAEGRRAALADASSGVDPLHDDAVALLRAYDDEDLGQLGIREGILAFLAARADAMRRSCVPGHLTASALVVAPERDAVLLTLHPRVGCWVQVGGHCEDDDATVAAAALREATEESGIAGLRLDPMPVQLDVHPVTCSLGVPTRHLDVRFVAVAPVGAEPTISEESLDLAWFPRNRLPGPLGADVPGLVERCFRRLA